MRVAEARSRGRSSLLLGGGGGAPMLSPLAPSRHASSPWRCDSLPGVSLPLSEMMLLLLLLGVAASGPLPPSLSLLLPPLLPAAASSSTSRASRKPSSCTTTTLGPDGRSKAPEASSPTTAQPAPNRAATST